MLDYDCLTLIIKYCDFDTLLNCLELDYKLLQIIKKIVNENPDDYYCPDKSSTKNTIYTKLLPNIKNDVSYWSLNKCDCGGCGNKTIKYIIVNSHTNNFDVVFPIRHYCTFECAKEDDYFSYGLTSKFIRCKLFDKELYIARITQALPY